MKAVAYARFSTDRQREESILAQMRAINEWAMKNDVVVVREYLDEGKSATNDDRPAFQKMIGELRQIKPNLVLVHKLDRFARDRFDAAFYRREIQKAGARLLAVDQPLDDSPESIFLEGILEAQAEFYSRNLAREVMKGMKENAYKARFNGGNVPLGFDIGPDRSYVINEEEAAAVRLIYAMKLAGNSLTNIVNELNRQGRTTKTGKPFGKNSIDSILRNERYGGTYVFNQTPKKVAGKRNNRVKNPDDKIIRVEGAIPAIIPPDEWKAVQEMLNARKWTKPRERSEELYVLTGVLKCGHCGAAMVGNGSLRRAKDGMKRYYYYTCSRYSRNRDCTNKKRYPKEQIEQWVFADLESKMIRPDNRDEFIDTIWKAIENINAKSNYYKANLDKQLQKIEARMKKLIQAVEDGMPYRHVAPEFEELGRQKDHLLDNLAQNLSPFEKVTRSHVVNYMKKNAGKAVMGASLETKKEIVASYIHQATILNEQFDAVYKINLIGCDNAGARGGTRTHTPRGTRF